MSRVKEMFGKKIKDLSVEEKRLYMEKYKYKRKTDPTQSRCYKMFGKRRKDLTHEELRAVIRSEPHYQKTLKGFYKTTFCYQHFGKRWRELTPEEKSEFWKIQKAKTKERKLNRSLL